MPGVNDITLQLGHMCEDNVGNRWRICVELRNWKQPDVLNYMCTEIVESKRVPRTGIASSNGKSFRVDDSSVITCIIKIYEEDV